jgi:hypothetical protein
MKRSCIVLGVAAAFAAASAGAQVMGKDEYRAHGERIEAEYKAAKVRCKPLTDNDRDLCEVRAHGARHIAKAELRAQYQPGPKKEEKLAMARAEAAYALAKERCDDLKGHGREVCRTDAKAGFAAARADAKTVRAAMASGERDASSSALYAAGKERCDTMTGQARDLCVADLRKRYGKL